MIFPSGNGSNLDKWLGALCRRFGLNVDWLPTQTGQVAKVFRVPTTASTPQTLTFDVVGTKYLIKNFTTDAIYVSMSNSVTSSTGIMIPAESSEILCVDESLTCGSNKVSILPILTATVGVEVRCLSY